MMASAPTSSETLSVSLQLEKPAYALAAQQTAWGVVTIDAPLFEQKERAPVDIVLSLDVSGSMGGQKLELAKSTLKFVVQNLRDQDRLALVTYDTNISTPFGLMPMTKFNKEKALQVITAIREGSSTDLCGGLLAAMDVMQARTEPNKVASVLIMTDGQANVGVVEDTAIAQAMTAKRSEGAANYTVYSFGFGADHKAPLLRTLSDAGQGMYYYIKGAEDIPESFADCLGGLLSVVGQNIQCVLRAEDGATISHVYTTKRHQISADGRSATIEIGDIQSEESRDILFQVTLPAAEAPRDALPAVSVQLTFFNVISSAMETADGVARAARHDGVDETGAENPKINQQRNRVMVASAISTAQALAETEKFKEARSTLEGSLESLAQYTDPYAQELRDDMMQCLRTVATREDYRREGAYYMSSCGQTHSAQRCNVSSHSRGYVSYATSPKKAWKASAQAATMDPATLAAAAAAAAAAATASPPSPVPATAATHVAASAPTVPVAPGHPATDPVVASAD